MKHLDRYVWGLHLTHRWLWDGEKYTLDPAAEPIRPPCSQAEWRAYFQRLWNESRWHWHGGTGRLVERLLVSEDEFAAMVRFQSPEPARCIGDSSHEYTHLIMAAAEFGDRGG